MPRSVAIALAQLNVTLGDIDGNAARILKAYKEASAGGADLVITPELSISGYQPDDLVQNPSYLDACIKKVESLAASTGNGPTLIVGTPWRGGEGGKPYNAAALLARGKVERLWYKYDLPNYSVFDEKRFFAAGKLQDSQPFELNGACIGVAICEDMWSPDKPGALKQQGAQIILSINASPFEVGKQSMRRAVMASRVRETGLPVVYVAELGGQDELVFDGDSFVMAANGEIASWLGAFEERVTVVRFDERDGNWTPRQDRLPHLINEDESAYTALLLGLREYINKNGFPGVLLGMSGGVDSAFVAALAVDAFGPDRVITVMMPSPYTSAISLEDAQKAAGLLGCTHKVISIADAMQSVGRALKEPFAGRNTDIAEQNIQSRLRGLFLMSLSNAYGHMVLATGNKSEMATGYATLYGDMCGGYAPIKDVYKTLLYRLARWRNANRPAIALGPAGVVIPERILTRAPTAELKHNQLDQDTLPPYETLDDILQCLVEKEMSVPDIKSRGHDEATVRKVLRMLHASEYKRRQAPPGTKITARSFGRDRRYPITNRFEH